MADDFFADLLPMRPKVNGASGDTGKEAPRAILEPHEKPVGGHDSVQRRSEEVPDLLSSRFTEAREERHAPSQNLVLSPEQLKDFESSVEVTLRRFANSLQPVLENVHRRLSAMETKLEAVDARLHDAKETEKTQGLGLQDRLEVWDKSLKDMHRGIQLIRDKQELLEAQSELAELKKAEETKRLLEARQLQEAKAAEAAEAASKASQAAAAPPAREAAPSAVSVPPATPAPSVASQLSVEAPRPAPVEAGPPPSAPSAPIAPQPQTPFHQPPPQAVPSGHSAPYGIGLSQPQYPATAPTSQGYPDQFGRQNSQNAQLPAQYSSAAPQQQPQQMPAASYQSPAMPTQHAQQPMPPQNPQYSAPSDPRRYNSVPQPQQQQYSNYAPSNSSSSSMPPYSAAPYASSYGGSTPSPGYPSLPQPQPAPQSHPQHAPSYSSGPPSRPPAGQYSQGPSSYRPTPQPTGGSNYQRTSSRPPAPPSGQAAPRDFPLEQVIDDVCNMGFSRHEVRAAVTELTDKGQAVDLNVLLDRLMNGPRR